MSRSELPWASLPSVGYPVHIVASHTQATNPHGVIITSWVAACGQHGAKVGHDPFGRLGTARRLELCKDCLAAWAAGWRPGRAVVSR